MRPETIARRRQLYLDVVEIVHREYREELTLDDLAHRLASSRRQIQRAFSEAGDTSFRAYLQRVRMVQAAALLRNPSLPVNRVASAVGYRQPAQFAKAFRRHHGRPPSEYRGDRGLAA